MTKSAQPGAGPSTLLKALILLAALPLAIAFSTVTPILPKLTADLAHTATDAYLAKMTFGIIGISVVIGGPLSGWLADKVPRRPFLAFAGVLFAGTGAAPFVLANLPVILLTRFVMGMGATAIFVIGAAMVGDYFTAADRARWMGRFEAVAMISGMSVLPLAGVMGDRNWREAFLLYLVGIPFAALAWFGGVSRVRSRAAAVSHGTFDARAPSGQFPYWLVVLGLLIGTITYVPSIYLPFHLANLGVRSPSSVGALLTIAVLVSSVVSTQFGRARLILSARAAFCCSFAAMAVALAVIALAPNYQVAIIGLVVNGLGVGWMPANLMASAVDAVNEAHRGRTLGIVRAAHSIAPAVGVTMLEPLVNRIGVSGILLVNAGLAVVMLAGTALSAINERKGVAA